MDVSASRRCAAASDLRAACRGVVDDLHERWPLPSAYLPTVGRLRCMASRGYFQVSDGFTTSTGVRGGVVSSGVAEVLQDVPAGHAHGSHARRGDVGGGAVPPGHMRDPSTGLRNRRGLLELLQRSAAEGGWALVLVDLDGFKAVNDLRGHASGDAVLSGVADSLTAAAPDGALVFRFGGDEFALLAPGLEGGGQAGELAAELVRAAARTSPAGEPSEVGASAGVRLLDPASAGRALADADEAL